MNILEDPNLWMAINMINTGNSINNQFLLEILIITNININASHINTTDIIAAALM